MSVASKAVNKIFIAIAFCCFAHTSTQAQGLQLMPMRVVFEGGKNIEELNVINSGKDSAIYNISLLHYRMKADGAFEIITEPDSGQLFADRNIRFFPRTVALAPGEAQVVKVQVIRASQLAPGEYRSHLYFRAVPDKKLLGQPSDEAQESEGISMQLVPVFGITIPIIVRTGELTAQVKLTDLSLRQTNTAKEAYTLHLHFNRSGNRSVYGDLDVFYVSPKGKTTQVGVVKGIAVYTPNATRAFELPLANKSGVDYRAGKLLVTYKAEEKNKTVKLAEAQLLLGQEATGQAR